MIVSHEHVKQFLLDVIDQANYPGKLIEFVLAVKQEVQAAEIKAPTSEAEQTSDEVTASDRMLRNVA